MAAKSLQEEKQAYRRGRGLFAAVRRGLFGLAYSEASFALRGFRGTGEPAQAHLERIGATFILGYNSALEEPSPGPLAGRLAEVPLETRGFAFEGAAMALALLDALTPWSRGRLRAFLEGGAEPHVYMVHVGAGWAWARLRRDVHRQLARMEPLLGWLALDGYGFHQGYFHAERFIERQEAPGLGGYADRAFDQGLGRSLWFVEGAGAERVIARVRAFPARRQPDLWSGVGLACAYAGGVARPALEALRDAAGALRPHLAQGVVFASRARERAGNLVPHTGLACDVVCGLPVQEAAALAESALADCGPDDGGETPRFERWRQHIQRAVVPAGRAA